MKLRFEVKDSHHPDWRGSRFTKIESARRELARSVPPGRFYIFDRLTKRLARESHEGS